MTGTRRDTDPRIVRTRTRVLAAGQRVLVDDGLDGLTLQRVAERAGVGRRTMYRHWPDTAALVRDVLALTSAPVADPGADVRTSVRSHLVALEAALTEGPLAYVLAALYERAVHDDGFERLRSELAEAGCRPLVDVLTGAARRGDLPGDVDVELAAAMLEGPIVHDALVRRRRTPAARIDVLVACVLDHPPTAPARERGVSARG